MWAWGQCPDQGQPQGTLQGQLQEACTSWKLNVQGNCQLVRLGAQLPMQQVEPLVACTYLKLILRGKLEWLRLSWAERSLDMED